MDLLKQALKRGIIFAGLVSDGDNDTFETLRTTDIYSGAQSCMMEYECLKHVQWQLYKNLSKLNKKELTWNICSKVGHLYYQAVANGSGNIDTIVENINGIPSHIEKVTGWLATDTIRQLSQYLSDNKYNSPHFLKRVRYGFTTTHNESLHRMLTRKVPKTGKVTYDTYRLGAAQGRIQDFLRGGSRPWEVRPFTYIVLIRSKVGTPRGVLGPLGPPLDPPLRQQLLSNTTMVSLL